MNLFLVCASTCLAVVSAGIAEFGGGQSNSGGYSSDTGNSGGYSTLARGGGGSSGFNLFGNAGGSGSNGLNGGMGFGGRGLSFDGSRGATGGQINSQFGGANNNNALGPQLNQQGGQVRRFVSVHLAPEPEPVSTEPRIIRAGGPPDTHYNIIFVKAPSANNQQQTEVHLPELPKQKTLIYVLVKKPDENQENVKIRTPAPTKPSKPEVYFIRYKPDDPTQGGAPAGVRGPADANNSNNFGSNNAGGFGNGIGLSSGSGSLDSSYGPPSQCKPSTYSRSSATGHVAVHLIISKSFFINVFVC